MVTVVSPIPHPSVVREAICKHCGVELRYVPADIQSRTVVTDYLGDKETYRFIECPACMHEVRV